MESFFIRYRNLLVLLAILLAQIVGLAVQVRHTDAGRNTLDPRDGPGVRLIRLWANALVSPPERLIHGSKLGIGGLWQNYIDLRHTREQNQELQKTIDRLRLEQALLLEDSRQGQRLQSLLDFQQKYIYKTVVAQAIGSSGSDQSRVFYIDKGSADGLDRDMAVMTPDGIVGKVRDVFPHSAQVLAINDQTSGAGVILETTRIRGILRGNAIGQPQIVGIVADQRIQPGEKVLTAGGDQIFPRGLPVGVVEKVVRDPDRDSFIDVIVKPAAHLDRLDEVLVVTATAPRFSPEEQQDLATSEALKGPEAAAIKEQKKASELMAEKLPGLTDPNAPASNPTVSPATGQPGQDQAKPATSPDQAAQKLLHPQHPDRFTPGAPAAVPADANVKSDAKPKPRQASATPAVGSTAARPAPKTAAKLPAATPQPSEPRRNP
ncbi:MAG: rod shape-determining protein MreC [Terracidiphilus sp.]|jgi:rod shape-determining protein MreC